MRKMLGIKEKIAYVVGAMYGHDADNLMITGITSAADTTPFNQAALKMKLDEVINTLERNLLNNQDFTESFIIRHATFNRFEMKLTDTQRKEVSSLAGELQKAAADQGFDTIEATMHFQHESDAQRIIKISEAVAMMAQAGGKIDQKILDRAEKLAEKVKPIKDLDKQYKHMMNMLNLVHRTARKGFPSMITGKQQKKLFALLNDMGVADPTVYILDASKVDQT